MADLPNGADFDAAMLLDAAADGYSEGMDDRKRIVREGYDRIAETYLQRFGLSRAKERWTAELADRLPLGGRVLDLGCGAGVPVAKALVGRGLSVVGVDASSRQLALARVNVPGAEFILGDLAELEMAPNSFDGAVAFYSLNHVPREQHADVLARVNLWLRPGGVVVANFGVGNDPSWVGEWLGAPTFFSSFDAPTSQRLVASAGFSIETAVIEQAEDEDAQFLWVVASKPAAMSSLKRAPL